MEPTICDACTRTDLCCASGVHGWCAGCCQCEYRRNIRMMRRTILEALAALLLASAAFGQEALHYAPSSFVQDAAAVASDAMTGDRIGVVFTGQSTANAEANKMIALATKTGLWKGYVNPRVVLVNCARNGYEIDAWDSATDVGWRDCGAKLAAKGLAWADVQVIVGTLVQVNTPGPGATITEAGIVNYLDAAKQTAPNLQQVWLLGIPSPYAAPAGSKVQEPSIHADHVLLRDFVEAGQWQGIASVRFLEIWTEGATVNASMAAGGLAPAIGRPVEYLAPDRIHDSEAGAWALGRSILGRMLLSSPWLTRGAVWGLP